MNRKYAKIDTGEVQYLKTERFVKQMTEVWRYVIKRNIFTVAEEKVLNRLSVFLQLNTNALIAPNGDFMSIEKMAEMTCTDRSNIRKAIKELLKKNALGTWRSGGREVFYMNPFLFRMGEVEPYLFTLFDEQYAFKTKDIGGANRLKAGNKVTSIVTYKKAKDGSSKKQQTQKAV